MMNGMMKMILQQTKKMEKPCIKVHVGVSAPNGDWATIICMVIETETHISRHIGKMQWIMQFIGFDARYRKMGIDQQERNLFG